jgi:hypothetical protein
MLSAKEEKEHRVLSGVYKTLYDELVKINPFFALEYRSPEAVSNTQLELRAAIGKIKNVLDGQRVLAGMRITRSC